jgi:hypothetical protein
MSTWKALITEELQLQGESWDDIVSITLTEDELNKGFDDSFGIAEGKPFTAWTARRVYFPVCYDGSEWVESVSRDPDGQPTNHCGGG